MTWTAHNGGRDTDVTTLTFRTVAGGTSQAEVTVGADEAAAPASLTARLVQLADGAGLRQLRVAGTGVLAGSGRAAGYERLDNEILAGLRLYEVSPPGHYPPQVSRLQGFEPSSAEPYALLEPYRGEPLQVAGQHLLDNEQHQLQVSLLTGLCWLAAAGIAHRGLAPSTVRWDGQQVQITDFSLSAMVGTPRSVIGSQPWAAPEQRPSHVQGHVSIRDDIWAAGRLMFYVSTHEELTHQAQLDDKPTLKSLLAGVFGPPEDRPTAAELLSRLNEACPVTRALAVQSVLEPGRAEFYAVRARKHPGLAPAPADGSAATPPGDAAEPVPAPTPGPAPGTAAGWPPASGRRWRRK